MALDSIGSLNPPAAEIVDAIVANALQEDRAFEDATTLATVDAALMGSATFLAKQDGVACGFFIAAAAFRQIDERIRFEQLIAESERFRQGEIIARLSGPVRAILQAERVALNFVQRLSASATLTRLFVDTIAGTKAVILDTRKTTPGLRDFEKYAVRCGGGTNHRRDLAVMAMIKDNHREAIEREDRSLAQGIAAIRGRTPGIPIELEIDSVDQLEDALEGKPEWVLLDNMSPAEMAEAVRRNAGRAKLEASGGVNLSTVRAAAETGVDAISVGALTHSAQSLDISLELSFG